MIADTHTGYGVRDGRLLFIADVERGLACGCVCARCGKKLVAKKGKERQPHFAHFEVANCQGAAESVLHLLAKELIAELDAIQVPPCKFVGKRKTKAGYLVRHEAPVSEGGKVRINNVRIEEKEGSFVPDIIIEYAPKKSIIVEIAVTHKVERAKLRRIRRRNLPAIEIRLDTSDSFLSRESLKIKLQRHLASRCGYFIRPSARQSVRSIRSCAKGSGTKGGRWHQYLLRRVGLRHSKALSAKFHGFRLSRLCSPSAIERRRNSTRNMVAIQRLKSA